ncbi:MAG TPA: class I SAM-dependent methyltransferase [Bryobacteraceae bacterium]|jgi:SAM-dependent methyltransferase|nr:class I SAM-dependent methyltransferase [Bryobacteraceae bacterium]
MSALLQQHNREILDQFTRQAKPFSDAPAHSAEDTLRIFLEAAEVNRDDEALDVACGPGIISCALAGVARRVTGIDLVPAMIEQARDRQRAKGLANIEWRTGDAAHLPFADNSFSLVATRYSFHHLMEPERVLREMARVCRSGGRIVVADVTPEASKAAAYDEIEKLRDPSHTHALPLEELAALGAGVGFAPGITVCFRLESAMEALLAASFPPEGNADRIRRLVRADIGVNRLGIGAFEKNEEVYYSFPTTVMVWQKRVSAPGQ